MKRFLYNLMSYIVFLITVTVVVSIGILIFSKVKDFETSILAIFVLLYILFTALIFFIIDYIRRNIIIQKPLNDILDATNLISKGEFDIKLKPRHNYNNYDELDKIMININKMAIGLRNDEILKKDFISNFSHEIKTPIAIMNGYINLLKRNEMSKEERDEYIDKLYNSSINLSNLISNILKLNKLENSEMELNDVNLSNVLENVIISYDELINNKKINLDIDMDDRLIKYTNESFIQLIFSNLISNAIKFSKYEGIVEIKLKNKNDYIEFMVKDNGIGMSKNTIIHIFNRFYQGDTSHKTEGNGLGLSMVKKAIDRLGYKISIESEEEKGSTFIVDIR
ncbi:MAG: HAMP domain-containing histidine kinase [Acholeplasmatales bacterium]|nr:HAMP domain-containing histidine kinase [Acholeplasmatales bacterium]